MYEYITEDGALARLCERVTDADWIAFDTEFVRESTYWPKLCLIQLADKRGLVACVDPLSGAALDPLLDLVWRPGPTKVFHAASQDFEVLYRLRGPMGGPFFDTQIAAALLGDDDQIGYAAAVEAHTGIRLDKAHTRTDWSRRPLREVELEYAADDVRHLPALYDSLHAELVARGRLEWALAESAALADPARYQPDPADAWKRIKGQRDIDATGYAALQQLAAWREQVAAETDRPRRWILGDEQLVTLARERPADSAGVAAIEGMPAAVARKHAGRLVEIVQSATAADGPGFTPGAPLDRAERDRVDGMMKWLRKRASELSIAPSMLATRRDIEALVRGEHPRQLLEGWRRGLVGEELLAMAGA